MNIKPEFKEGVSWEKLSLKATDVGYQSLSNPHPSRLTACHLPPGEG